MGEDVAARGRGKTPDLVTNMRAVVTPDQRALLGRNLGWYESVHNWDANAVAKMNY